MQRLIVSLFIFMTALTGCGLLDQAASSPDAPSEATYLRAAMDESLFPYANIDAPTLDNLGISDDGALELRLFPGQPLLHNGVRAQVGVDYPYQEGDTVRYEWQLRFPVDFQADPLNRWWIIAEWHDQPDTRRGESWESHPVRSAIILFTFAQVEGQPVLGIHYGPEQALIGTIPITPGEWMPLAAVIHWSQGADGWMEVFSGADPAPVYRAEGQNMYNAAQHYFLAGLYRHREIALHASLRVRGIQIAHVEAQ